MMSEQVNNHITENLKIIFAAYHTGTPNPTSPEETMDKPIISQPPCCMNDKEEEK